MYFGPDLIGVGVSIRHSWTPAISKNISNCGSFLKNNKSLCFSGGGTNTYGVVAKSMRSLFRFILQFEAVKTVKTRLKCQFESVEVSYWIGIE